MMQRRATQGGGAPRWSRAEREAIEAARDPVLELMLKQERVETEALDTTLFLRLVSYLGRHRALAALCVVLSLGEALLMALPPYAIGVAMDLFVSGRRAAGGLAGALGEAARALGAGVFGAWPAGEGVILGFGVVILGVWLLRWGVAMSTTYMVQKLGQRIVHDLRMDVYRHITSMDMGYFHSNPVGRLVNRTTFDVQALSEFFSDAFAQGVRDVLFIGVLVVVMLGLDVPLAMVLLVSLPLLVLWGGLYARYGRPAMRSVTAVQSRMNGWLAEHIAGMRENQLYRMEARRREEFHALTNAHQAAVVRWIQAWGLLRPAMMVTSALATTAVLVIGYGRATSGSITVGVLLTFLQYTTKLWVPVRNLTEKFNMIQTALTSAERIFDVLETKSLIYNMPDASPQLKVTRGDIEFSAVHFRYPTKEEEALRGVDFKVKPGQFLALVGDTGAGKSTVAHLVSRFYDVTGGAVLVDGHDVRRYTLDALRRGIALVPQDVVIFAGTLRDNITLGHDVDEARLVECVRAVCADRVVNRFPRGLDHIIEEGGRTLSAGERQLISFARALVFNPPILILDEATANVDTQTEALIQRALAELTRGRTSVVIAHRLSTIRDADEILVLRQGQIIERGRHEALLDAGGEYARLYRLHVQQRADTSATVLGDRAACARAAGS
jgi:ABC-type multidrug transport system fused ATPase/permease subunit